MILSDPSCIKNQYSTNGEHLTQNPTRIWREPLLWYSGQLCDVQSLHSSQSKAYKYINIRQDQWLSWFYRFHRVFTPQFYMTTKLHCKLTITQVANTHVLPEVLH